MIIPKQPNKDKKSIQGIVFSGNLKIRETQDGKVSIIDVIREATSAKNPRDIWARIIKNNKTSAVVAKCDNWKFPGERQRLTPVCSKETVFELFYFIPGAAGDKYKTESAKLVIRFLGGDITLADEIIQRNNNPEDLNWLQGRVQGKITRRGLTDEMKECGATKYTYIAVTNINNKVVFNKSAKQLKVERGVKSTRDGLSNAELTTIAMLELLETNALKNSSAKGDHSIVEQCRNASNDFSQLLKKYA